MKKLALVCLALIFGHFSLRSMQDNTSGPRVPARILVPLLLPPAVYVDGKPYFLTKTSLEAEMYNHLLQRLEEEESAPTSNTTIKTTCWETKTEIFTPVSTAQQTRVEPHARKRDCTSSCPICGRVCASHRGVKIHITAMHKKNT